MKSYQSYNPSGIEWISEKPENWSSTKLKYVSNIITGNTPSKNNEDNYIDGKFLWIKPDGLNEFEPTNDCKEKISEIGLTETRIVPPYSVLINGIGNIGKFGYSELPVSTNQQIHSIVFNPKKVDKRYGLFLISSLKDEMNRNSEKVVVSIYTKSKLERLEFILPPLQEQEQIVKYLDEKTTIIDKLISTKQRKVELLKEQRTTLINQVITKGLNSNVKMKDSGVEWIGEIPESWVIKKMKYCLKMISEKKEVSKEDIKISPENVENGTGICFNFYSDYTGEGMKFIKGDILLNKLRIYLKKILITESEGFSMGEMIVLRTIDGLNKYYYYTLFNQGLIDLLNNQSTGVKLPRVSPETILNSEIVYPPIEEQKEIIDYIDKHTKEIDDLVSMEKNKIELLKEYRQSLISEVITGKIKVV